jgi:hypothetical protein
MPDNLIGPTGPRGGFGPQGFRGEKGPTGPGTSIDPAFFNSKAPINNPTFTGTVSGIDKIMVGLGNVDNTSDALKPISTKTQEALDLKADLNSPTFTGTVSGINKIMVGLGNVDNTSDALKPISTKTQEALDLKADIDYVNTRTISKAMVGLGNVDNTSDDLKPISTKTQEALDLKADKTFVDTKIMDFIDSAPDTLNTLKELSDALGNDTNFSVSLTNSLALKASTSYLDQKIVGLITINTIDLDTNKCYNITNYLSDGKCNIINNIPFQNNSINNEVRALCAIGSNLYIGGNFTTANGITVNRICKYDTTTGIFSAMGSGVNGYVLALCAIETNLYIGGSFTSFNNNDGLGNITANRICKYDTTTGLFSAMGSGVTSTVYSIHAINSDLYIGGSFTTANGITANRICKYNTSDLTFSAMGNGVDSTVYAIHSINSDLYIGGAFTTANGITANRICKYNISDSTFYAMGSGVNGNVNAIHAINSDLYIGGAFTSFNNNDGLGNITSSRICKYNTSNLTFSAMGIGVDNIVYSIRSINSDLYIGGFFTNANGITANRICKYNTSDSTFSAMGNGIDNTVYSIHSINSDLYIGGSFTTFNTYSFPYFLDMKNVTEIKYNNISLGFSINNTFEPITSLSYDNKKYITFLGSKFIINK